MVEQTARIELPAWLAAIALPPAPASDEACMRLAIKLAGENVARNSGGPFGAVVRSDSAGVQARAAEAERVGVDVEQDWLSDPLAAMWERRHDKLDEQTRPIGGTWTTPLGVVTRGPGLSGDPGEDCNCVCATALKVKPKPAM